VQQDSVLHFRVWPNDIDLNLHMNDGRYISISGLGRADLLVRSGLLRKALKRGWAPVVGGAMIRYRREIRTFARFTLRSRIVGWDEKWVYIEHEFESGGKRCAVVYVRSVLRSRSGAVPTADVMALMEVSTPSPPLPDVLVNWPAIEA
jgi:acyl-CoA thioesterase FadM